MDFGNISHGNDYAVENPASLTTLVPPWSKVCVIVFIVIAMLIGIPGNGIVTMILLKLRQRTSTDWFVIFISITDIFSLLVSGPTHICIITPEIWSLVSSPTLCRFHIYFSHFVGLLSACLITSVGVDRYFKTCKPHSEQFTSRSAVTLCVLLTVGSALTSVSHFFTTKLNTYGDCVMDNSRTNLRLVMYGFLLLFTIASIIVICFLYIKIDLRIRKRVQVNPSGNRLTENSISQLNGIIPDQHRNKTSNFSTQATRIEVQMQPTNSKRATDFGKCESEDSLSEENVKSFKMKQFEQKPRGGRQTVVHAELIRIVHNRIKQSWKQVNKTTQIMGAISVVFILSTFFPTIALAILTSYDRLKIGEAARIMIFFMLRFYMINNFANPVFYAWLSSEFRKNVRNTLKSCRAWFLN